MNPTRKALLQSLFRKIAGNNETLTSRDIANILQGMGWNGSAITIETYANSIGIDASHGLNFEQFVQFCEDHGF
jgi:Ca2+-binding EF-hand superfamily protein